MRASQGRCSGCGRPCTVGCVRPAYCNSCKPQTQSFEAILEGALAKLAPRFVQMKQAEKTVGVPAPIQAELDFGPKVTPPPNTKSS